KTTRERMLGITRDANGSARFHGDEHCTRIGTIMGTTTANDTSRRGRRVRRRALAHVRKLSCEAYWQAMNGLRVDLGVDELVAGCELASWASALTRNPVTVGYLRSLPSA